MGGRHAVELGVLDQPFRVRSQSAGLPGTPRASLASTVSERERERETVRRYHSLGHILPSHSQLRELPPYSASFRALGAPGIHETSSALRSRLLPHSASVVPNWIANTRSDLLRRARQGAREYLMWYEVHVRANSLRRFVCVASPLSPLTLSLAWNPAPWALRYSVQASGLPWPLDIQHEPVPPKTRGVPPPSGTCMS